MSRFLFDDGTASRLSAEAKIALVRGQTSIAAEKSLAAGQFLVRRIANARKQTDIHLLRFLAASQFYHGGHYKRALDLTKRINDRFLNGHHRELFNSFVRDCRDRSSLGYNPRIRSLAQMYWQK